MVLRSQASGKETNPLDVGVADVAPGSAMAFNPVRAPHCPSSHVRREGFTLPVVPPCDVC